MTGLTSDARAPSAAGRLIPRYDPESNVLSIESDIVRPWPYGVNIDGLVLLDLDENRILAAVELLIPRTRWKELGSQEPWPRFAKPSDLMFRPETIAKKTHHLPVSAVTDPSRNDVLITFSSVAPNRWIQLSDNALAAVGSDELLGFRVRLVG